MRYSLIDLFRVLAILLIIFYHISMEVIPAWGQDFINIGGLYKFNTGSLGVTLFIIISGLSLAIKYKKEKISYLSFITKRFLRIYPPFLIALGFSIIIYFCIPNTILELGYYYIGHLNFSNTICSLTGFCHFFGKIGGPFLGPSWFIGLIIALYLLFPLLLRKIKKNPHLTLIIIFLISFIFRYFYNLTQFGALLHPLFPLAHLFEFALGIYLGLAVKNNFWSYLNKYKNLSKILFKLGLLSFPFFLIHHPLLFIVNSLEKLNISYFISIPLYLLVSGVFSFLLLKITRNIPRKI